MMSGQLPAVAFLELIGEVSGSQQFLERALELLGERTRSRTVQVWEMVAGVCQPTARLGGSSDPPLTLVAEALDGAGVVRQERWTVVPISNLRNQVWAFRDGESLADATLLGLGAACGASWNLVRERENSARQLEQANRLLRIAGQWNQTAEMDKLLEQMAEASTELFEAERASIFVWDREGAALVGRPALGIAEGELRVPDDKGVVGHVFQTGQPKRVDIQTAPDEINRQVDRKTGFETRSLLCVPLSGRTGERFGVFELINKRQGNFSEEDERSLEELAHHAATALENTQQREQLLQVRDLMVDEAVEGTRLLGNCPAIDALRSTVQRVANTDLAVLILGENGTGKEVVARRIHYLGARRNEPFVAVNCAALTETLLESELFGHEEGAFTDARETRVGKFELASGGTLFLDEIGDMSLSGQAKLLRVLEDKVVVRVGGSTPIRTDARVIAATNQNLANMVREKRFREDLYYRLNVVTVEMPPLRERGDDVLELAEHFLGEFSSRAGRRVPRFTAAARKRLRTHAWPGNVRELRNLMERLAYLSSGEVIDIDELAFILAPRDGDAPIFSSELTLPEATRVFQAEYIKKQIDRSSRNMTEAAERLGLHRSNLYRKMRQLDMEAVE